MRRREGWEGVVSSGKKVRVSYEGRVMHYGLCREAGHKRGKCPNKDKFPENSKKRNREKKTQNEQTAEDEVVEELERQGREETTGETDMMDEILREQEQTQGLDELEASIQKSQPKETTSSVMKFMPNLGLRKHMGQVSTGNTPPVSTSPVTTPTVTNPPVSNKTPTSAAGQVKKSTPRKRVAGLPHPRKK